MTNIAGMRAVGLLLRRPPAPGERRPRPDDWGVVAVIAAAVVVETIVRSEVTRPALAAVVTAAGALALPWRRQHPLAVLLWTTGSGAVAAVVHLAASVPQVTPGSAVGLALAPYALYRWGSGGAAATGTAVLAAAIGVSAAASGNGWSDVVGASVVVTLLALLAELNRQRVASRARELDRARMLEREHIARDLHDTVAHRLSAVAVRAQAGQVQAVQDPAYAVDALRVVEDEARRALTEMRDLVRMLRESGTPEQGPGIADVLLLAEDGPPPVRVSIDGGLGPLAPETATAVFRIAQEAVTNTRRHARGATAVTVRIGREADDVLLEVCDDGRPAPAPQGRPTHEMGFGLIGMAERATALGGTLEAGPVASGRAGGDHGWAVRARLPATTRGVR